MAMSKTNRIVLLAAAAATLVAAGAGSAQRFSGYPYQTGQELYEHVCQGCHMPDAKGAAGAGAYPALAGNTRLQAGVYPVIVMLRGQKAMPSFSDLSDAQIAEVTNYIRTHFGNQYPGAMTADQVAKLRPQQIKREAQRPG
jgi:mono/diheme cytochrome c family protein